MPGDTTIEVVAVPVVDLAADDFCAPAEPLAFRTRGSALELVARFRGHTPRAPGRWRPKARAPPSYQRCDAGIEVAIERELSARANEFSEHNESQIAVLHAASRRSTRRERADVSQRLGRGAHPQVQPDPRGQPRRVRAETPH